MFEVEQMGSQRRSEIGMEGSEPSVGERQKIKIDVSASCIEFLYGEYCRWISSKI